MRQDPCGRLHELRHLRDDELPPARAAAVVAHVQACKPCQVLLERLVTRPIGAAWAPAPPVGAETTDMVVPPVATESDGQEPTPVPMATLPAAGSVIVCHGSGETTEHSVAGPSPSETMEATAVPQGMDHDDTRSRIGEDDSDAQQGKEAARVSRRPSIPGYELREKLGEGGMGVVYLARQVGLNRRVAVKMIRGGQQARPEHFARFRLEAEAVAQLRHPNILQIYEIGEVDDLPFVSLELLEGGSLADRLDGTPLPGRQAAELLITLAGGVQTAHDAGIIHRDLKPSNVLFNEEGQPKITDFGLAKRMESDSRQTESGQIMGSPSYMAPEQARGDTRDVGPAADIYALGAILYEMLTGRPPFRGESPMETVRQVIDDEVVLPSRLVPRISADLETICLKCLDKDPLRRYVSAAAMADDLGRYRDGETILARRAPLHERALKWARRRPAAAAMLGLGLAVFLSLPPAWMIRQRNAYLEGENKYRRVIELIQRGDRLIDEVRDANDQAKLSSAQVALSNFRGELSGVEDQRLDGLRARIEDSLAKADRQLRAWLERERDQRTALEKQKGDLAEKQRFRTFVGLRTKAQLGAAEFDLGTGDRSASLGTARDALAVYARDPRAADRDWELARPLSTALDDIERRRVVDGCYDLLLVLSRAVEPAVGIKILDRATALRPGSTAGMHIRRADCLARSGDIAGRDRELALARKCPSVTALDHLLMGRELMANRQWSEAVAAMETALRLEPDQASARLLLAICEYNVKPPRLAEAQSNLDACIGSHSDLVGLYLLRALVHGEQGFQALSRIDRSRPAEMKPLLNQAEAAFQSAEADYRSALDRHPGDDLHYVLLVNRGGMLLRARRYEDAIAALEEAIKRNPRAYQAHATLGQLFQRAGRFEDASRSLGRAIERAQSLPARLALHRGRGRLSENDRKLPPGRLAAALADLDEAIRLDPENGELKASDHVERARLLFHAGRFDEALAACAAAIAIVPDQPVAHRLRISSLMALKRYGEVLGSCDAYLAREQPTVEVLEIRGLARLARQDYSGAVDDYAHALGLRPAQERENRTRLLNERGWAYHFADAPRLARDDFEASLRLAGDQSEALAGRGLARIRLGEWRPAVADAEAAIRLASLPSAGAGDPEGTRQARFNAARIYAQAVEFAAGEVSLRGEHAVALYRNYRTRALDLLEQALRGVSTEERDRFLSDPALKPLRLAPGRTPLRLGTGAAARTMN